jgi:transposase-like protein
MTKLQPSKRISNEIENLLRNGIKGYEQGDTGEDLLSILLQKGMQKFLQETLEQEVKDHIGRDHYQRRENEAEPPVYRNGYENRYLKTGEGKIAVEVPQLRNTTEPYRSTFIQKIGRISPVLENMVREMYVRGLSTRDIEETLRDKDGKLLLSKTGVSEITESLTEEYEKFRRRDLSNYDVIYLFADGESYPMVRK